MLTPDQIALGRRLVDEDTFVRAAAKVLRRHHATLYRTLDNTALAAGPDRHEPRQPTIEAHFDSSLKATLESDTLPASHA